MNSCLVLLPILGRRQPKNAIMPFSSLGSNCGEAIDKRNHIAVVLVVIVVHVNLENHLLTSQREDGLPSLGGILRCPGSTLSGLGLWCWSLGLGMGTTSESLPDEDGPPGRNTLPGLGRPEGLAETIMTATATAVKMGRTLMTAAVVVATVVGKLKML